MPREVSTSFLAALKLVAEIACRELSLAAFCPICRAIAQEPGNVECLHLLGEVYAECFETDKAKNVRECPFSIV